MFAAENFVACLQTWWLRTSLAQLKLLFIYPFLELILDSGQMFVHVVLRVFLCLIVTRLSMLNTLSDEQLVAWKLEFALKYFASNRYLSLFLWSFHHSHTLVSGKLSDYFSTSLISCVMKSIVEVNWHSGILRNFRANNKSLLVVFKLEGGDEVWVLPWDRVCSSGRGTVTWPITLPMAVDITPSFT